jgi:hypothetical protein
MDLKFILLVCSLVVFMAVAPRSVAPVEIPYMVASVDNVPLADDATIEFINTYMRHGEQFSHK